MTPAVRLNVVNPAKGLVDADVWPTEGAEAHRIGFLKLQGWWCVTCDHNNSRNRKRCRWIRHVREHPDVPDMEGI